MKSITRKVQEDSKITSKGGTDPASFSEKFKLIIAHTPEEKQRAFSLRHAVFHEELNYDIGEKINEPLERDSYDQSSILCLIQHKESGIDAGCLRVVIINNQTDNSSKLLPLEEYCKNSLNSSSFHLNMFPKHSICEVSRLAVHPSFRRSSAPPTGTSGEDIRNIYSANERQDPALISLSLFLAATAIVGLCQRRHVFAMIEPRFNRLLKASGLNFQKVGESINYCGARAAHYIDQKQAEKNLPGKILPLYHHIKKELSQQVVVDKNDHKKFTPDVFNRA